MFLFCDKPLPSIEAIDPKLKAPVFQLQISLIVGNQGMNSLKIRGPCVMFRATCRIMSSQQTFELT